MADHTLDGVLMELDAAVASANARLRDHRCARWRRGFGIDSAGPLEFEVPTLGAGGWRTLQVPLESLMCRRGMAVAELRVEIGCALRILRPAAVGGAPRIAADPGVRRGAHRLDLWWRDAAVEVRLDGVALRRFRHGDAPSPKASPPPRPLRWKWVRPRPRLLLEGEDARRALAAIGPVLACEAADRRRRLGLMACALASLAALAAAALYLAAS